MVIKWNIHPNFNIFLDKGIKREEERDEEHVLREEERKSVREENSLQG